MYKAKANFCQSVANAKECSWTTDTESHVPQTHKLYEGSFHFRQDGLLMANNRVAPPWDNKRHLPRETSKWSFKSKPWLADGSSVWSSTPLNNNNTELQEGSMLLYFSMAIGSMYVIFNFSACSNQRVERFLAIQTGSSGEHTCLCNNNKRPHRQTAVLEV